MLAEFDAALDALASLIGLSEVLAVLPSGVSRISVVAGGRLSDIPLAALRPRPGAPLLGSRFALADLPCLSLRLPLRRRARSQRGDRSLLVRPHGNLSTSQVDRPGLLGDDATVHRLRSAAATHDHQLIRVDTHGAHDASSPMRSSLALTPPDGDLTAEGLRTMDLSGCATLILGACESGMAQRVGRDEPLGFVRAALRAGASAVVAARWDALDPVAVAVLDRFEHYLTHLPRDIALHKAQNDLRRGELGVPRGDLDPTHPAAWSCWTLYGDPGLHTRAGRLRRFLRATRGLGDRSDDRSDDRAENR